MATLLALPVLAACQPAPAAPSPLPEGAGRLWQDAAIFDEVRALIGSSGSGGHLWIEMYEFGRADLAALLGAARSRGADVRVITDPSVDVSRQTATRLSGEGIDTRFYPIDDKRHQIDHVKLVVAEGTALVGGMNWGQQSSANHDYALLTRAGAEVSRLRGIFLQDWSLAGGAPGPLAAARGPVVQTAPGEEVRALLLAVIAGARHSIDAQVYTFTDGDVTTALVAAEHRGVVVRVMVDASQQVNRPAVQDLESGDVATRTYTPPGGGLLHAKAGLFDRHVLLLGSANWTRSGLSVNHELDLETTDSSATAAFATRFEQDWSGAR